MTRRARRQSIEFGVVRYAHEPGVPMSKPMLVAGLVVAALAFGYTVADSRASVPFLMPEYATGLPVVVVGIANAVAAFLGIWLYEGIFRAVHWAWRSTLGGGRRADG